MILVIGATGRVGFEICRQLTSKGRPVKAMVRSISDPVIVKRLENMGAKIVEGDIRDTLNFENLMKGTTTIISTVSSVPYSYVAGKNDMDNVDLKGMQNLIDFARESKVKRFIYTSFSGNISLNFPLKNAKRSVETYLANSGMVYTILRPSFFMESWLSSAVGFDIDNAKVTVYGSGKETVSYISANDVASFAIESLTNPFARNATLELGGPDKLSQLDVVSLFEKATGKKFELNFISIQTLEQQFETAPNAFEKSFAGLQLSYAKGDVIEMRPTLDRFVVKLTSVKDYIRHMETVL